nr:putative gdp-l-fucose synthase 1 [Quercus suber]
MNVGSGKEISIKELAKLVKDVLAFEGKLVCDMSNNPSQMGLLGAGVVEKVEVEVEIKEYKYKELVKALENFENSFARQEAYDGGALVVEHREE